MEKHLQDLIDSYGQAFDEHDRKKIDTIVARHALSDIAGEYLRAKSMYPEKFVNQHEAYAVILEEVDELWAEIKKNQRDYDLKAQRKEAIQIGAMIVRFLVELV